MGTVRDLITLVLKDSGVFASGQTPLAEDMNDMLVRINNLIGQWSRRTNLLFQKETFSKVSTGAQTYTVGAGQDFDTGVRIAGISSAYMRLLNNAGANAVDIPLTVIESQEDYNEIALKSLVAFPQYVWFNSGYPTGLLYFWPVPQAALYQLFITTVTRLGGYTQATLDATLALPDEYNDALYWALMRRTRVAYRLPPDPEINLHYKAAMQVVSNSNVQIKELNMPDGLVPGGSSYNIYSDQSR